MGADGTRWCKEAMPGGRGGREAAPGEWMALPGVRAAGKPTLLIIDGGCCVSMSRMLELAPAESKDGTAGTHRSGARIDDDEEEEEEPQNDRPSDSGGGGGGGVAVVVVDGGSGGACGGGWTGGAEPSPAASLIAGARRRRGEGNGSRCRRPGESKSHHHRPS